MKLKKQLWAKQMVIGAVSFAFFAGFQTALGIGYLSSQRSELRWLAYFAGAFGFCVASAKYALNRLKTQQPSDETSLHNS